MSNALVKRLCNALEAQRNGELVRRSGVPPPVLPSPAPKLWKPRPTDAVAVGIDNPPVVELPVWCSVYDGEMSLSRYILRHGVYEFNVALELTRQQRRRYTECALFGLPAAFPLDVEQCAICGTWTPDYAVGAVSCSRCAPVGVCFGRTSLDRYFMCRESCGEKGKLSPTNDRRVALIPGCRERGNFGMQF